MLVLRRWRKWQSEAVYERVRRRKATTKPFALTYIAMATNLDDQSGNFAKFAGLIGDPMLARGYLLATLSHVGRTAPATGAVRCDRKTFGLAVLSDRLGIVPPRVGAKVYDALLQSGIAEEQDEESVCALDASATTHPPGQVTREDDRASDPGPMPGTDTPTSDPGPMPGAFSRPRGEENPPLSPPLVPNGASRSGAVPPRPGGAGAARPRASRAPTDEPPEAWWGQSRFRTLDPNFAAAVGRARDLEPDVRTGRALGSLPCDDIDRAAAAYFRWLRARQP